MVTVSLTSEGTGEGIGDPAALATFCVTVMLTGVVTVFRTCMFGKQCCHYRLNQMIHLALTAATTVRLPPLTQLWEVWTRTES